MSANGAFSTTLDFEFFGGGYTQLSGGVSGFIETSFVSYAQIPIAGTLNNFNLDFELIGFITAPIIQASAELSFGFTSSSTIEFGVIRYATVEYGALVIPFTQSAQGYNLTHAHFNPTLEFTLDTNIYVWSAGDSVGSYGFSVESLGVNVSTRTYSKDGANYVVFNQIDFNDLHINDESNSIKIISNGMTQAEIIQK